MNIESDRMLESILESLSKMEYIKSSKIPDIDLYMDQGLTCESGNRDNVLRYDSDSDLRSALIKK